MNGLPLGRCPRCGGGLQCGATANGPCACTAVALSAALLARLRRQFNGCLCLVCLRGLAAADTADPGGAPAQEQCR